MKVLVLLTLFVSVATYAAAVENIRQCGNTVKPADDDISITKCTKPPCDLRRKTDVIVEFKFKTDKDVPSLTNTVFARIAGLPLPFIGVDNTDACKDIFTPDGQKVGCPLKAGQSYVYKNSFKILPVYPRVNLEVHWALTGPGNKDVFCFEIPAKITGA